MATVTEKFVDNGDGTFSKVFRLLTGLLDDQGDLMPDPDSIAGHDFTYDGSNNVLTDTFTYGGFTYTQTYTWSSGNLVSTSDWVRT